jgi:hypothetical protein
VAAQRPYRVLADHGYYPLVDTVALAIDRPAAEWQKASAREAVHPGRLHSGTVGGFKSEWWARSFVTTGDVISVCLGEIIGIRTLSASAPAAMSSTRVPSGARHIKSSKRACNSVRPLLVNAGEILAHVRTIGRCQCMWLKNIPCLGRGSAETTRSRRCGPQGRVAARVAAPTTLSQYLGLTTLRRIISLRPAWTCRQPSLRGFTQLRDADTI